MGTKVEKLAWRIMEGFIFIAIGTPWEFALSPRLLVQSRLVGALLICGEGDFRADPEQNKHFTAWSAEQSRE